MNEVGVREDFRRQGTARALYRALGARETKNVVVHDWNLPEI